MCLPARAARSANSKWISLGSASTTAPMSLSASTASASRAGMPRSLEKAASRSGLRPTQATISILSDCAAALASTRPQLPGPIKAVFKGAIVYLPCRSREWRGGSMMADRLLAALAHGPIRHFLARARLFLSGVAGAAGKPRRAPE